MLASHEKMDVSHRDGAPHFSAPLEQIDKEAGNVEIANGDSEHELKDFVMPGSDKYSDAYKLFADTWNETVVSKVRDVYAAEKFLDFPQACSRSWALFVQSQSSWIERITKQFAHLGSEFLADLDALITLRSKEVVQECKERERTEREEKYNSMVKAQAAQESGLRDTATQQLADGNTRIRKDKFTIPESKKHLSPKPEEVVILSASDFSDKSGWRWRLHEEGLKNRDEYAKAHGYRHVFINFTKYDAARSHVAHPCWLKLPAIQEVLFKYPETKWVWWLDMDAIIWNGSIKLEDHILNPVAIDRRFMYDLDMTDIDQRHYMGSRTPKKGEFDTEQTSFIFSPDLQSINAGSFFVKNTPATRAMLEFWGDPEYIYNEDHENKFGLKEQDAFVKLYLRHKMFRDTTAIVPQAVLNSYGPDDDFPSRKAEWGDLVVHFAGRSSYDDYHVIWDKVYKTRILGNGERAEPDYEMPDW
ncbi:Alpha-1,2-galactosyltransferase gmh3 [Wickerhamiella sorbophila]|uniref:Alpha-1,2-galactosyltransferase gmh3 n=1 Tax=Wickerhamiella sorbophila TaxID=45607 RepID=A0A2T0FMI0_9ASCO|nr:Alpha-1,2-galactosyltransferase gmh3 [Wickerhamiella sorbophila]PRT56179.1 Alpha-1,2-galactosyltransferase gmh3 [Wickerhamiella sorbophila]